ncbi:unnamed protein product [Ceutorhynchus assimilis]|uniref:Spindle assembly abnormal protein 6 N-terminal domain-containing protein n=1 Tax=Ceutorhynchus assimilis TaxID=467358 RepID=A0A9N9MB75_9CUCU|nr:unnamed protein product [Ceutorhynchus assimilis]
MANEKPYKFNENIIVPVVQSNGRVEEKGLYITIWEDADMDRLQIQIRDWTNHSFNYIDFVDPENFEVMRSAQSLEMNFSGFKENIVAMLRQYQEDKMSLECHIFGRKCTLIFYMKAKMGYLVLLTVDLKLDETIDESQSEEQEFQVGFSKRNLV